MKKSTLFGITMFSAALLTFSACDEDNTTTGSDNYPSEEELELVINTYVDKTVVPTYADMKAKVTTLKTNVDKFVNEGTQASLNAACEAWRASREPWELSEAFLFGPADFNNLDPMLDSWPLDKNAIEQILAKMDDLGKVDADENIRGFHTLEFLLFENGDSKKAENVTNAEKTYMTKVATLLLEDTEKLYGDWINGFANEFKKHESNRVGGSAQGAIEEIVDGCMGIANEVGSAKIGDPYQLYKEGKKDEGVLAVESWYSWNSLIDYVNNVISIENSYMGGRREYRSNGDGTYYAAPGSLSLLVKEYNADADAEIQKAIADAIVAINGIPAPFRSHLDKKTEIENAQKVLAELEETLKKIKSALGLN